MHGSYERRRVRRAMVDIVATARELAYTPGDSDNLQIYRLQGRMQADLEEFDQARAEMKGLRQSVRGDAA